MKTKIVLSFILLVVILSLVNLTSASVLIGKPNNSIEKSYGPGASIIGWMNISLKDEPMDLLFEDDYENSVSLFTLLNSELNKNFKHTCVPLDCEPNYAESNSQTEKTLILEALKEKIIGFKIDDEVVSSISGFSLNINSNVAESAKSQLSIDILDEGEKEWKAYKPSVSFGDANYGCFQTADIEGEADITTTEYCNKITIPETPKVEIGADVEGTGTVEFEMHIYNEDLTYDESCKATASASGQISCFPELRIEKEQDFYVCIRTKKSADNNKYKLNYEKKDACGYAGGFDYDFAVFAKAAKYAPIGSFVLDDDEVETAGSEVIDLAEYVKSYLEERYDLNCAEGCIIPIRFTAEEAQTIIVSGSLSYTSGIATSTSNIYDLESTPAIVSSGYGKLFLDDGKLIVPTEFKNYTYTLKANDKKIFSEKIAVEPVPEIKYLTPLKTAMNYPTEFVVKVNSSSEIAEYFWDFGDGKNQTTTTSKITHAYSKMGDYQLKITVKDKNQKKSSKAFTITVGSASEIINELIEKRESAVISLKSQINSFQGFTRQSLNKTFNIDGMEDVLKDIKDANADAETEDDYQTLLAELLETEIPSSISTTMKGTDIIFVPQKDNIDLEAIKEITESSYDADVNEETYLDSILIWNIGNIDVNMDFEEVSGNFGDFEGPAVNVFEVSFSKKQDTDYNLYIIIRDMEDLNFEFADGKTADGYIYFELADKKTIRFSTTEDVSFIDVPMFVAPPFSKLSLVEEINPEEEGKPNLLILILALAFVLIVGIIIYIILQEWYKKKYENYLFRDKNDLYNLASYVQAAKKRRESDKDIIQKLKKTGWSPEQIRYVMRKYLGKRTGMVEIRIGKNKRKENRK